MTPEFTVLVLAARLQVVLAGAVLNRNAGVVLAALLRGGA